MPVRSEAVSTTMWSFLNKPLFELKLGSRLFVPSRITSFAFVLLLALLLKLSFWQWQRGVQKEAMIALYQLRAESEPLAEADLLPGRLAAHELDYRTVRLTGRFRNEQAIVLDNQPMNGRPGYQILTPLDTGDALILINRGWQPADPDRRKLPAIPAVAGELTVQGQVLLPKKGFTLGEVEEGSHFPLRVQQLDFELLKARLGQKLLAMQILLAPTEPHGFKRQWQVGGVKPEKNYGYAVQWLGLAILLTIFYGTLNLRRQESRA